MTYLALIIGFNIGYGYAQGKTFSIDRFTTVHGISDDNISDLVIDESNNVWFAHRRGIVKYDGGNFIESSDLQFDKRIRQLEIDKDNVLWILFAPDGKKGESLLNQITTYNLKSNTIEKGYFDDLNIPKTVQNKRTNSIKLDYQGNITIIFSDHATYNVSNRILKPNDKFKQLKDPFYISDNVSFLPMCNLDCNLEYFVPDQEKNLKSIVFENSVLKFRVETNGKKDTFTLVDNHGKIIIDRLSSNLQITKTENEYYFYTENQIVSIDNSTDETTDIAKMFLFEFQGKEIHRLRVNNNIIWVATSSGLLKISQAKNKFPNYLTNTNASIRDIERIGEDSILIASEKGLYLYNPKSNTTKKLVSNFNAYGITPLGDQKYHIGSYAHAFFIWDKNNPNKINDIKFDNKLQPRKIFLNGLKDTRNRIWITNIGCLIEYDPKSQKIKNKYLSKEIIEPTSIYETKRGEILCLSPKGIHKVNHSTKTLDAYRNTQNLVVTSLYEDTTEKNIIWISTKGNGLLKYNITNGLCDTITTEDGLLNNNVHVSIDLNNKLWLSTDFGISVLDKKTKTIYNITDEDGLHENEMNRHSYFLMPDSSIILGSINGFIHFDPKDLDLSIDDKELKIQYLKYEDARGNEYKNKLPESSSKIIISTNHLNPKLIVNSSSKNYSNQIRYLLIDPRSKWQYLSRNEIDLSRLRDGQTEILISKKIDINEWSDPLLVKIKKEVPIYKNWWFYTTIVCILILGIIYWINYVRIRTESINKKISKQVTLQTEELSKKNEKLQEAKSLNDQIFSIIGHDLRSPILSLLNISNSLNYLINKEDHNNALKLGNTIELNATNLLSTVDRLLQWSNSYKSNTQLPRKTKMSELMENIVNEHAAQLKEKRLEVKISSTKNDSAQIFAETIGLILGNLFQNAIKYSHSKGIIKLEYDYSQSSQRHSIRVIDNGVGVDSGIIEKLKTSTEIKSSIGTNGELGLGLGLRLCISLLDKIGGHMTASKASPKGSVFTIYF